MIPYFLGNISAKTYRNRIVYAKIIASRRWDVFLRHGLVAVYLQVSSATYRSITVILALRCLIGTDLRNFETMYGKR